MRRWLPGPWTPRAEGNEETAFVARALNRFFLLTILVLFVMALLPVIAGGVRRRFEVMAVSGLVAAAAWLLLRQGRTRAAMVVFGIGEWLVITAAAFTAGGVHAPAYMAYLIVITFAALFLSRRILFSVLAASLLSGLTMVVFERLGELPRPLIRHPLSLWAAESGIMLAVGVLVWAITRGLRDAVARARAEVAERQRAEKALRESQERFRSLVEATSDWIWEVDAEAVYTYASPKIKDLLGYEPEEVLGKTPYDLMPPDEAARVGEAVRPYFARAEPFSHVENRNLHKDGRVVVLDTSGVPIFDERGALRGFRGIDRDITEQKRAEEALRASEARLRALFAAMSDVILVLDVEGRYLEIAPTKPDLLYRPAHELLGKTLHEIFPRSQADFFLEHIRRAIDSGETSQIEYRLPIGGRELQFVATISALSPTSAIVVARDITTQVEQYERLIAAERARADLAEHVKAEIDHRARNNLAMVSGLLQLQALREPDPRLASQLRQAVLRIRTFVDIHEKVYAAGREEVNLLDVLQQMAVTLSGVLSLAGAALSVEGEPCPCPTRAATNLAVAANELIMNALRYGGPADDGTLRVTVRLACAEGKLCVTVQNSGPPVPAEFDPESQQGLGLRLVSHVARGYGGRFTLRPAEGGSVAELVVEEAALQQ